MKEHLDFFEGAFILLSWMVLLGGSLLVVAGILRAMRWIHDRWLWKEWFSL